MKNNFVKKSSYFIFFLLVFFGVGHYFNNGYSANLNEVSVTLSNSRPSFRGALASGNTVGSSIIYINTTQNSYPSTSSAQLVQGDTLRIGSGAGLGTYVVANTSSLSTINLTSELLAGHADVGDDVIATSSTDMTVRFKTTSAVANGKFRILVPAHPTDATSQDGIPDGGFYDIGGATPATITCPNNIGSTFVFSGETVTASNVTIDGQDYHSFVCPYTGTGAVNADFDANPAVINNIINPAPSLDHTTGTADTYPLIIQQLNGSDIVIDSTTVKVGIIEAVKVTAEVAPSISFKIIGVPSGTNACGVLGGTSVTTTPASVPFGYLSIVDFTTAAQTLSVSTNAINGYTVTAIANDQLGRNGQVCPGDYLGNDCIQDSRGDSSNMTHLVSDEWNNIINHGFAYSLHDNNSTVTPSFSYNESSRTFSARQFADAENNQDPVEIFGKNTVALNDNLFVCYKIIPSVLTAAGQYENYITYTATATF